MSGMTAVSTFVNNFSSSSVTSAAAIETRPIAAKSPAAPVATASAVPDQVKVSSTGTLVAQALSTSDVRMDKVAQLQAAIASGTYSVSSTELAGKMIDSLLADQK